jgi:hypothetical protein
MVASGNGRLPAAGHQIAPDPRAGVHDDRALHTTTSFSTTVDRGLAVHDEQVPATVPRPSRGRSHDDVADHLAPRDLHAC